MAQLNSLIVTGPSRFLNKLMATEIQATQLNVADKLSVTSSAFTYNSRKVMTGSSVGNSTTPVYIDANGYPVAISSYGGTVAVANKLGTATVGSGTKFIYLNGGTATASSSTVGASNKGVYLNSGTVTAMTYALNATINAGAANKLAYYSGANAISQYTSTIGTATKGVYMNAGWPTAMTYELKATLNNATQWGVAYYSTATNVTSTAAGTAGYLLQSNGAAAPSWIQATNANTANTIVKRDGSGNFSAGTITASLNGNAATASKWLNARKFTIGKTAKTVDGSKDISWSLTEIGPSKSYSSFKTPSANTFGWYTIATISDSATSPAIFFVRAYAHTSLIFTATKGWSANGSINILDYQSNSNQNYASVHGVRLLADGQVQIKVRTKKGSAPTDNATVSIAVNVSNCSDNITIADDLVADDTTPSVIVTREISETGIIVANKFIGLASKATADSSNNTITTHYLSKIGFDGITNKSSKVVVNLYNGSNAIKTTVDFPTASASQAGAITTGTQTLTGTKTLDVNGSLTIQKASGFNYSGIETATGNRARNIWFSHNDKVGTPVKNDKFKFNPGATDTWATIVTNATNKVSTSGFAKLIVDVVEGIAARAYADDIGNTISSKYVSSMAFSSTGTAVTLTYKNGTGADLAAINVPVASTSSAGVITNAAQTVAGDKTLVAKLLIETTGTSSANKSSAFRISSSESGAGTDIGMEFWRGTNASWQIVNSGGNLYFKTNYTGSTTNSYSLEALKLNHTTGAVRVPYLGINGENTGYRLYVNGTSYFTNYLQTTSYFKSTIATGTAPIQVTSTTLNTNLNADLLDGYHADMVYKAATHKINNYSATNDWLRIATIKLDGSSLSIGGFTAIFSNRECLDSSSFILTVAIRRNSTTSVICQAYVTPIGTSVPREVLVRSNDGVNFYVYFKSVLNLYTTYYNVTKIMSENNVTFENVGLPSSNLITGSVLNVTASRGGYVYCAQNADAATKLSTARTISLTGSVTGSGSFDGSGNLSITTTTNHNHDSSYVNITGDTMTGTINSMDIIPKADNTYTLGTSTNRWKEIFGYTFTAYTKFQTGSSYLDSNNDLYIARSVGIKVAPDTNYALKVTDNSYFNGHLILADNKFIRRSGRSVSWIYGRDGAILRQTTYTGYNPIISAKTTDGDWSFGPSGSNIMYLTYCTDANYNAGTNTTTAQFLFKPDGTMYIGSNKVLDSSMFSLSGTTLTITI